MNGKMLSNPVLTVDVATEVERCMCVIAASKSESRNVPDSLDSLLSIATRVAVFPGFYALWEFYLQP
jgi:hypothetical protein